MSYYEEKVCEENLAFLRKQNSSLLNKVQDIENETECLLVQVKHFTIEKQGLIKKVGSVRDEIKKIHLPKIEHNEARCKKLAEKISIKEQQKSKAIEKIEAIKERVSKAKEIIDDYRNKRNHIASLDISHNQAVIEDEIKYLNIKARELVVTREQQETEYENILNEVRKAKLKNEMEITSDEKIKEVLLQEVAKLESKKQILEHQVTNMLQTTEKNLKKAVSKELDCERQRRQWQELDNELSEITKTIEYEQSQKVKYDAEADQTKIETMALKEQLNEIEKNILQIAATKKSNSRKILDIERSSADIQRETTNQDRALQMIIKKVNTAEINLAKIQNSFNTHSEALKATKILESESHQAFGEKRREMLKSRAAEQQSLDEITILKRNVEALKMQIQAEQSLAKSSTDELEVLRSQRVQITLAHDDASTKAIEILQEAEETAKELAVVQAALRQAEKAEQHSVQRHTTLTAGLARTNQSPMLITSRGDNTMEETKLIEYLKINESLYSMQALDINPLYSAVTKIFNPIFSILLFYTEIKITALKVARDCEQDAAILKSLFNEKTVEQNKIMSSLNKIATDARLCIISAALGCSADEVRLRIEQGGSSASQIVDIDLSSIRPLLHNEIVTILKPVLYPCLINLNLSEVNIPVDLFLTILNSFPQLRKLYLRSCSLCPYEAKEAALTVIGVTDVSMGMNTPVFAEQDFNSNMNEISYSRVKKLYKFKNDLRKKTRNFNKKSKYSKNILHCDIKNKGCINNQYLNNDLKKHFTLLNMVNNTNSLTINNIISLISFELFSKKVSTRRKQKYYNLINYYLNKVSEFRGTRLTATDINLSLKYKKITDRTMTKFTFHRLYLLKPILFKKETNDYENFTFTNNHFSKKCNNIISQNFLMLKDMLQQQYKKRFVKVNKITEQSDIILPLDLQENESTKLCNFDITKYDTIDDKIINTYRSSSKLINQIRQLEMNLLTHQKSKYIKNKKFHNRVLTNHGLNMKLNFASSSMIKTTNKQYSDDQDVELSIYSGSLLRHICYFLITDVKMDSQKNDKQMTSSTNHQMSNSQQPIIRLAAPKLSDTCQIKKTNSPYRTPKKFIHQISNSSQYQIEKQRLYSEFSSENEKDQCTDHIIPLKNIPKHASGNANNISYKNNQSYKDEICKNRSNIKNINYESRCELPRSRTTYNMKDNGFRDIHGNRKDLKSKSAMRALLNSKPNLTCNQINQDSKLKKINRAKSFTQPSTCIIAPSQGEIVEVLRPGKLKKSKTKKEFESVYQVKPQ